jgi:HD-like signal output (HDOD) protein
MSEHTPAGTGPTGFAAEDWAARIQARDLGALTATVQRVQAVVGDERSSLHDLSRVLQNDSALVARVLHIANSPGYAINAEPVSTITRASSLIGFDAIRNICIANRLLEVLLAERELTERVRERLLRRVASSLHAAIQARMLLGNADARVREEAFLAALLEGIGESAFWSSGGEAVATLDAALEAPGCDEEAVVRAALGGSFRDLSAALTRAWGLDAALGPAGDALPVATVVRLANRIAETASREGWQSAAMRTLVAEAAKLLGTEEDEARLHLQAWGRQAEDLASCYGANQLARRMNFRPAADPPAARPRAAPGAADPAVQQRVLQQLQELSEGDADLNTLIRTAMDGVHTGIGMERTLTALLSQDRASVQMRFVLGDGGEKWGPAFRFALPAGRNVLRDCIVELRGAHYSARAGGTPVPRVPPELRRFSAGQDFVIAPIVLGARSIGLLYADRAPRGAAISAEEYATFVHFAERLGSCLTAASRRRG